MASPPGTKRILRVANVSRSNAEPSPFSPLIFLVVRQPPFPIISYSFSFLVHSFFMMFSLMIFIQEYRVLMFHQAILRWPVFWPKWNSVYRWQNICDLKIWVRIDYSGWPGDTNFRWVRKRSWNERSKLDLRLKYGISSDIYSFPYVIFLSYFL